MSHTALWDLTRLNQFSFLILLTSALRLAFAATIGLGVDESYMVSAGRALSLGYFDHPPAAWWLSWSAAHLFGTEAPIVARLPFILLFALTTWLMARLGAAIGGPRAGFWAAVTLNVSPVFGITSGTWVLPDGPLDCALTGAALCSDTRVTIQGRTQSVGMVVRHGVMRRTRSVFEIFRRTDDLRRVFIPDLQSRPPRLAAPPRTLPRRALIALLVFSPVVLWNATHGWASFAFQGARAAGLSFHPLAPFTTLAGEALFVLPWFWVPMMILGIKALRADGGERLFGLARRPTDRGLRPWSPRGSSQRVLYHWAAPGYLMLFPFLGRYVAIHWDSRAVHASIMGSVALCLVGVTVIATQIQFDWLRVVMPAKDPTAEGMDWTSVHELTTPGRARVEEFPDGTVVGVPNWRDAGKIAHALGPEVTVICLNADARQFGSAVRWDGADVLLLSTEDPTPALRDSFAAIEPLPPSAVTLRGRTIKVIHVAIGRGLKNQPPAR